MITVTLGIDLGKSVFHIVGQDAQGEIILRRRMGLTHPARAAGVDVPGRG